MGFLWSSRTKEKITQHGAKNSPLWNNQKYSDALQDRSKQSLCQTAFILSLAINLVMDICLGWAQLTIANTRASQGTVRDKQPSKTSLCWAKSKKKMEAISKISANTSYQEVNLGQDRLWKSMSGTNKIEAQREVKDQARVHQLLPLTRVQVTEVTLDERLTCWRTSKWKERTKIRIKRNFRKGELIKGLKSCWTVGTSRTGKARSPTDLLFVAAKVLK